MLKTHADMVHSHMRKTLCRENVCAECGAAWKAWDRSPEEGFREFTTLSLELYLWTYHKVDITPKGKK